VIRYKWVESFNHGMKLLQNLNLAALVTGLISCVGMTMVANFEVRKQFSNVIQLLGSFVLPFFTSNHDALFYCLYG